MIDKRGIPSCGDHCAGVDIQPVLVRQRENLQQADRILLKEVVAGERDPSALQHKAIQLARAAEQGRQEAPSAHCPLVVQMREEHAG